MKIVISKILRVKSSEQILFFTCISIDWQLTLIDVPHESSKAILRNSHFENVRACFLRRCQNSLWQTSPGSNVSATPIWQTGLEMG